MDLLFERGSADRPAGHALVYFQDPRDGVTLATYLVVLPVPLELGRYVPPLLAQQFSLAEMSGVNVVPLPPVPERVEGVSALERLADLRRDDLIAAGSVSASDMVRLMAEVGEIAQQYARLYESYVNRTPEPLPSEMEAEQAPGPSVNEVLYSLMSEQQKLAELARLAGQLRYAVEGRDQGQINDLIAEIKTLGQHLPSTYDIDRFLEAATRQGPLGDRLSALYLDRYYKLAQEDYAALEEIDREIERLRGSL